MSGVLRPWLLSLAADGWFRPVWSDKIGHEWRRNAARLWNVDVVRLEQAWQDMEVQYPAANLSRPENGISGWTAPSLRYSDAKDWHVILTGCQAREIYPHVSILTWNLKDFQKTELKRLGLGVVDPDRCLTQWWNRDADLLRTRLKETVDELIEQGRRQPEPLSSFLKRERLFRLSRLLQPLD